MCVWGGGCIAWLRLLELFACLARVCVKSEEGLVMIPWYLMLGGQMQAVQRLEKARVEEAETRRRVEAVHSGGAGPLSDSDVKRRTKNWSSAIAEVCGVLQLVGRVSLGTR